MISRDAYVEKLKAQLDEWNGQIDALEERLERAGKDARAQYQAQFTLVRDKRDELVRHMTALRAAGEQAWQDLRAGVEQARDDLGAALRSAASRLK